MKMTLQCIKPAGTSTTRLEQVACLADIRLVLYLCYLLIDLVCVQSCMFKLSKPQHLSVIAKETKSPDETNIHNNFALMQMVNLTASQSRGLATGEMFNRKGEVRCCILLSLKYTYSETS